MTYLASAGPGEGWAGLRRRLDKAENEGVRGQTRFCTLCAVSGVRTPSEHYRNLQLDYCTFHYWLIHGRRGPNGYPLEDYVSASQRFAFRISLPQKADRERMLREQDNPRGASMTVIEPGV